MKIIKIAQEDQFINEGVDPLESPLRDQLEAEDLMGKDEYTQVSDFIEQSRDMVYDLQKKIMRMTRERDEENWDYFKQIGVLN